MVEWDENLTPKPRPKKSKRLKTIIENYQTFPDQKHDDYIDSTRYIFTKTKWTWKFIFDPYKFWIGVELDRENKTIYVLPFLMIGIKIYKKTVIVTDTLSV